MSHSNQAHKLCDFLRRDRTAIGAVRQVSDDLARTPGFVMTVEMPARIDLLQARNRRPFRLIVGPANFKRTNAGVIGRHVLGAASIELLPEFRDSLRRKV